MGLLNRIFGARPDRPETSASLKVTGVWEGHYTQHNDKCSIRASLTQDGDRVSGTMMDVQTETDRSLFDAAIEAGLPPGSDEKLDEQIRQIAPEAGNEAIRAKMILPEQSQLDGIIEGRYVRFTKVYQGEHFTGFQVGDKIVGDVIENHSVQYSGRLSGDGLKIEGQWTIYQPEAPKGYIDGMFVLRKV